jgi:RNA polymerase sigma-70 factor (ECF subfamily)
MGQQTDAPSGVAEDRGSLTEVVRRAQRGDAIALDQLLKLLGPYVGRLCGPIALEDGPDAAQETLIAVFRGLAHLREPEALFGWVRAIAVREAVRCANRNRMVTGAELGEVASRDDPQLVTDIRSVLQRLAPDQRAVLVLRHVEGLDEQAVARLLEIPVGTVRSRLFRARHNFRRAWES